MPESNIDIAFFVPCYNESENIVATLENIVLAARKRSVNYEIVVIDDCSTDETRSVVLSFKNKNPDVALTLVCNEVNRGLGFGHHFGASVTSAKYYSIIPGDNDFPAAAIEAILQRLGQADLLLPYARYEDFRKRPFFRRMLSRFHTYIVRALSGYNVHYFNSPAVYPRVFVAQSKQNTTGFGYFSELLCEALDQGYKYLEFPIAANYLNEKETYAFRLKNIFSVSISLCHIFGRRFKKIFQKIRKIIFINLKIIAVALVVGSIYFLPNVLIPILQSKYGFGVYHPMSLEAPTLDEVAAYGSRLREVMDGHWRDGDAYLFEYKNRPTIWGSNFMAIGLGIIPALLQLDNPTPIFVASDFIFPVITFLIFYAFFYKMTRHRFWSALSSISTVAFPNISAYRAFFSLDFYRQLSLEKILTVFERSWSWFTPHLFVPGFSLIFFALFLLGLAVALQKDAPTRKGLIFSALCFGALFYVYFFYWAFALVALTLLSLIFIFLDRARARATLKIFFGGLIFAVPYFIKLFLLRANPIYGELSRRVGIEVFNSPLWSSFDNYLFILALIILGFYFGWRKGRKAEFALLSSFLLTIFVVLNIQVITGFNIQIDHWGSRVNTYILTISAVTVLFWLLDSTFLRQNNFLKIFNLTIVLLVIFFVSTGFLSQVRATVVNANDYRIPSDLLSGWSWINNNTPRDAVFLSPSSKTTFYLPFFTHGNVYVPPACYTLASNEEIIERFLTAYAIFGVPEEFLKKSLEANLGDGANIDYVRGAENDPIYMLYCDTFAPLKPGGYIGGSSLRPYPPELIADLFGRYRNKLSEHKGDLINLPHQADYVFYGPHERLISTISPRQHSNLRLIFSQNLVEIYEILP